MSDPAFRCSAASREEDEPALGTASTVRRYLLLEEAGPWGISAVRDSRLDPEVKARLEELATQRSLRPLLVRRPRGVPREDGVRLFHVDAVSRRLRATTLPDARGLLETDLDDLPEVPGPLFAVCTHGRHDACCAERGRPLAAAMAHADPARTWEVSHIGGDRFAPNVLVLPGGWYYGRLTPTDAAAFVAAHLDGRVDPTHLRGRSVHPFPVQAAEVHLRLELGELGEAAVEHVRTRRDGADRLVDLIVAAQPWSVRVRPARRPARALTCRASVCSEAVEWQLVSLERQEVAR